MERVSGFVYFGDIFFLIFINLLFWLKQNAERTLIRAFFLLNASEHQSVYMFMNVAFVKVAFSCCLTRPRTKDDLRAYFVLVQVKQLHLIRLHKAYLCAPDP